MTVYNGAFIIPQEPWSALDTVAATDATLTGCGGFCGQEFFHRRFPEDVRLAGHHIAFLETLALLVAAKLWGKSWCGKQMQFLCDSADTVSVHSVSACSLARGNSIWWVHVASTLEFQVKVTVVHIPGESNHIPDSLSRWYLDMKHKRAFSRLTEGKVSAPGCLSDLERALCLTKHNAYAAGTSVNLNVQIALTSYFVSTSACRPFPQTGIS
ncbi:Hypp672 [Branchiostoma lanceolatum]|uniref:Hypp672 protein n=1 Tax=Branchiostoma lanceolatum TaxID=7740 RepID=A0A8J9YQC1_BRALA|nr:Hypp672 [Branchiostoma lanceolatum]